MRSIMLAPLRSRVIDLKVSYAKQNPNESWTAQGKTRREAPHQSIKAFKALALRNG